MKLTCKLGATCFGYVSTNKENPKRIEADKEYELEKAYDEVLKVNYYKVFDNNELITTISESEAKLLFEI